MLKYDLFKYEGTIFRVLEIQEHQVLVIDCLKQTMPVWMKKKLLSDSQSCSIEELQSVTGVCPVSLDSLSAEQKKVMYQRHSLIVPILPYLTDERRRSSMIRTISMERSISKQTIRKYLCQYLCYMDITILAPKIKSVSKELTADEKNMRWALNKFFYTRKKHSLKTAYTLMLRERYCSPSGDLVDGYPSFYQFRYYYRKT